MRIIHRIGLTSTTEVAQALTGLGISAPDAPRRFFFELDEADPKWSEVRSLVATTRASDDVRTEFSRDELDEAAWLTLEPQWHHGYPQPEHDDGYMRTTFGGSGCSRCGVGVVQVAPFRLKAEPRWGKRNVMQLNWVFDEFFVTPELWSAVFEPIGVAAGPVLGPRGLVLSTVVQLQVAAVVDVAVADDNPPRVCGECGQGKHLPHTRGPSPGLSSLGVDVPIARSSAWFGDGGQAFREVLVSQELRRSLVSAGARGVEFTVCAAVDVPAG